MATIVVEGGTPLRGEVRASGSKNAALPILAAALLNEQPVALGNVPGLRDVTIVGDVLRSLGCAVGGLGQDGMVQVDASSITNTAPPYELVNQMRASFLVLGPLLARFGEAAVPLPGGCAIGARPVGEHLAALEALGAEVTQEAGSIVARAKRLRGTEVYLNIVSVGATENTVMAAALAEGTTTIYNAAEEPEVVDLCRFLTRCGVQIEGTGSSTITVHGQRRISAAVDYSVIPDRIEAGTYLLAILGTGGSGTVNGVVPEHLEPLVLKLRECGVHVETGKDSLRVENGHGLKPTRLRTAPYPGFPTDLQPQFTTVLTAATGVSTVQETIFEKRLAHVPELRRMGAHIEIQNGNTAIIESTPGALTGVPVEAYDLRCTAALIIAGLMARGETHIDGLRFIVRGYERLPEKFAELGGKVRYEMEEQV
jgi:UDP-N-acetylglucosamine 1-carboxyvinyltransferase